MKNSEIIGTDTARPVPKNKKCCYCHSVKSLDEYFISKKTTDGHWHWCKECERAARKQGPELKHCVSFSGGKDSTAMLILMMEKKMRIDKVIYFDCEDFEFPEMREHIDSVKRVLGVEIETVKTVKPWEQYLREIGWASPTLRWCTNEKVNSIRRALRFCRPNLQYIGYASDEQGRVARAQNKNAKRNRDKWMSYRFPLVEWGITEKEALAICRAHGFTFEGLYDYWDRVSCWCCPLQGSKDIQVLKTVRPKLYEKLWEMHPTCPEKHRRGH
jgi:3'-phosphoadenosine 5'-phosphosulfate sulfotransferase (PAPS reductase)/FAD synthetase